MKIGNFYFSYRPIIKSKFISIEFNPEKIGTQTKRLNELTKQDWKVQLAFQTESGVVIHLVKEVKK